MDDSDNQWNILQYSGGTFWIMVFLGILLDTYTLAKQAPSPRHLPQWQQSSVQDSRTRCGENFKGACLVPKCPSRNLFEIVIHGEPLAWGRVVVWDKSLDLALLKRKKTTFTSTMINIVFICQCLICTCNKHIQTFIVKVKEAFVCMCMRQRESECVSLPVCPCACMCVCPSLSECIMFPIEMEHWREDCVTMNGKNWIRTKSWVKTGLKIQPAPF